MYPVFPLAQAAGNTEGRTWLQVIQATLERLLDGSHLTGWVDKSLVAMQFLGFVIASIFLTKRFVRSKDNPDQMIWAMVALVFTLFLIGQPRYVLGLANGAARGFMPQEFRVTFERGKPFQPPKVMQDMIVQIKTSINPAAANSGGNPPPSNPSTLQRFAPALAKFLEGVRDNFDPRFWLAQATAAVVQFFADLALFVLGILTLVMALVMEINLLVFPAMVALWHVEMFAGVAREFCKHCIAVLFWPFGWGIGVLSAQGVMGGVAGVDASVGGIIAFTLSIFLVCFWLIFASIAAPVFMHRLITSGASLGQGLMVGGLSGGGAAALGVGGFAAGKLLAGAGAALGKGMSMLGSKIAGGSGGGSGGGGGGGGGKSGGSGLGSALGGGAGALVGGAAGGPVGALLGGALGGAVGKRALGSRGRGSSGGGSGGGGGGGGGSGGTAGSDSDGGGDGEGGGDDSGSGTGGGGGGIIGRVRSAVGRSLSSGGALTAQAGKGMGGLVNGLAARGAMKLDQVGDAYSEVGGAPKGALKANNHALRRRAEQPLSGDKGGGGGGSGGSGGSGHGGGGGGSRGGSRGGSGPAAGSSGGGGGSRVAAARRPSSSTQPSKPAASASGGGGEAIDADWEIV